MKLILVRHGESIGNQENRLQGNNDYDLTALGKVQAEQEELGLPISNAATGVQTHEILLEANYNIYVYRGVDFRPDFQYIIRPNAQSTIRDAAVLGFKLNVEF